VLSPSSGQEGLRLGFARSGIGPCAIGLGSCNIGIGLWAIGIGLLASPTTVDLRCAHPMSSLTFVPAFRLGGAVAGCYQMPRIVRLHGFHRSREGLSRGISQLYML
jgi:hypothetical protein